MNNTSNPNGEWATAAQYRLVSQWSRRLKVPCRENQMYTKEQIGHVIGTLRRKLEARRR